MMFRVFPTNLGLIRSLFAVAVRIPTICYYEPLYVIQIINYIRFMEIDA